MDRSTGEEGRRMFNASRFEDAVSNVVSQELSKIITYEFEQMADVSSKAVEIQTTVIGVLHAITEEASGEIIEALVRHMYRRNNIPLYSMKRKKEEKDPD